MAELAVRQMPQVLPMMRDRPWPGPSAIRKSKPQMNTDQHRSEKVVGN